MDRSFKLVRQRQRHLSHISFEAHSLFTFLRLNRDIDMESYFTCKHVSVRALQSYFTCKHVCVLEHCNHISHVNMCVFEHCNHISHVNMCVFEHCNHISHVNMCVRALHWKRKKSPVFEMRA